MLFLFLFPFHRHGNKRHLSRQFNSIWYVSHGWNFFANFLLNIGPFGRARCFFISDSNVRTRCAKMCSGNVNSTKTNVMDSRNNNAKMPKEMEKLQQRKKNDFFRCLTFERDIDWFPYIWKRNRPQTTWQASNELNEWIHTVQMNGWKLMCTVVFGHV